MTSTLIIYKDARITPERNFVVESISDYLATLTKLTNTDFQFQRFHYEMEVKFDLSQVYQEFNILYNYNYASITDGNGRVVYYFIVGKRQVASSTMAFKLVMDTANTFQWNVDFTPSSRTKVIREHKKRFLNKYHYLFTYENMRTDPLPAGTMVGGWFTYADGTQVPFSVNPLASITNGQTETTFNFQISDVGWTFNGEVINRAMYLAWCQKVEFGGEPIKIDYLDMDSGTMIQSNIDPRLFPVPYEMKTRNPAILIRNVDFFSENIPVELYKTELGDLRHNEDSTWNLIYQNSQNDDNVIDCLLIPSETGVNFVSPVSSTLTYSDFEDGKHYYFASFKLGDDRITELLTDNDGVNYQTDYQYRWIDGGDGSAYILFEVLRTGTTLKIRRIKGNNRRYKNPIGYVYWVSSNVGSWKTITSLTYDAENLYYIKTNSEVSEIYVVDPSTKFSTSGSGSDFETLNDVSRVEPELIKIISIPYFPTEYQWNSTYKQIIPLDNSWEYVSSPNKELKLKDLNTKFSSTIVSEIDNPFISSLLIYDNITKIDDRNDALESKLYHSDFYQIKFVYDSFGFTFQLEKIDTYGWMKVVHDKFTFEFFMTSTINSKFMFRFNEYVLNMSQEDYDNILTISRNNEAPIYNSAYITYLRTAYRYDLKALEMNKIRTITSFITGYGNSVASGIQSGLKEDWAGFGRTIGNMPNQVIQTIYGLQSQQNSMDSRLATLQKQAVSVSGSDDIDLLDVYSGNRAKLVVYKVADRVKSLLADLFYYYGYLTNEMKVPSINTRLWFNYLQCELEIDGTGKNLTQELIDSLKQRYSIGITFLHKVVIDGNPTWNFNLDKENWENSLL